MWRLHRHIGMGGDQFVEAVAGPQAEKRHGDALRDAWVEEFDALLDEVHAVPRATELVRGLGERGWSVVLATSGKPHHVDRFRPARRPRPADRVDDVRGGRAHQTGHRPDRGGPAQGRHGARRHGR